MIRVESRLDHYEADKRNRLGAAETQRLSEPTYHRRCKRPDKTGTADTTEPHAMSKNSDGGVTPAVRQACSGKRVTS
jgi:hypothetical protein